MLESLIGLIRSFPYDDPTYERLHEDLNRIRGKFRQVCARWSTGVCPLVSRCVPAGQEVCARWSAGCVAAGWLAVAGGTGSPWGSLDGGDSRCVPAGQLAMVAGTGSPWGSLDGGDNRCVPAGRLAVTGGTGSLWGTLDGGDSTFQASHLAGRGGQNKA